MTIKASGKHKVSLLSWRKKKQQNASSEKNKQARPFWTVLCAAHGLDAHKMPSDIKWVKVGHPRNKREAMRGCPHCNH